MKKQLKYSINMEITLGHLFKKLFNKACFRKKMFEEKLLQKYK